MKINTAFYKLKNGVGSIIVLMSTLLMLSVSAFADPSGESYIQPVKIMIIGQKLLDTPFAAQAEASKHAALAFRIPGQIMTRHVRMGDSVKKGQVLAELDPTDYELAVQSRQTELDLAAIRAKRNHKLFQRKLISEDQHDRTQTELEIAEAKLAQAKTDLRDTRLLAPFDGYISMINVQTSEVVRASQNIMTLENNDHVDLTFNLPVQYGRQAMEKKNYDPEVTFAALPDRYFSASVKEFASQPDPDTNSYRVTLTLPRPKNINILTGMSAWVILNHLVIEGHQTVLPLGAIVRYQGEKPVVWRIDPTDNTIREVMVEVDAQMQVLSGLKPGEQIVAAEAKSLTAGQTVRPWVRERGI